jgi:hypothetical protein
MSTEDLPQSIDPTVTAPMADQDPQTAGGKVLWHFTMSLDGFVAGPNHTMDWMTGTSFRPGLVAEYVETTGAVLGGRDGFDAYPDVSSIYGGAWQGPVFVLTHHPEDTQPAKGVTFLSCDVAEAVRIGLEAAGGKNLEIFSPTIGPTAPRARTDRRDRPAYRTGAARRRIPPFRQPGGTRGWMGLKCRRSSVATLVTPSRSAAAMRLAAVSPSGKSAYCSTSSAMRLESAGLRSTGTNSPAANSRKNATSASRCRLRYEACSRSLQTQWPA